MKTPTSRPSPEDRYHAETKQAPLFQLGALVATPEALHHLEMACVNPLSLVRRHLSGDFGQLCSEDIQLNYLAIGRGLRILSAYEIAGEKYYCITEADRSSSCLLLANQY